uniref:Ubiquitin thioesterase OTU n=1 Tax=Tetradesmus obliquus TaxID=3088 RepID=A0A383VPV5_TETOB|eukprot:jgi/Sobl393_1/2525/SZX67557.1
MQANRAARQPVRYAYRGADDEDDGQPSTTQQQQDAEESSAESEAAVDLSTAAPSSSSSNKSINVSNKSWLDSVASSISSNPAVAAGAAAGLAAVGIAAALLASLRKGKQQGSRQMRAGSVQQSDAAAAAGASSSKVSKSKKQPVPTTPGPNSKVKPSRTCAALADGSAVVMLRPIAADNSCLFNAVGYTMHHSTNRAPFLRQVVSREVSSDPQKYSPVFLGMENAVYCNWITNPAHWGGGIELSILAAHYRREIAAWNLATGALHVFGEEEGYTKQVMVIYNGVHYDALAIAASPRAEQDEDVTEYNPRTRRGKMILAAAQQLVKMHLKGKTTHHEQQQQKKQEEKAAAKEAKSGKSKAAGANGPSPASAAASSTAGGAEAGAGQQLLVCGSCGEQAQGLAAAKAHAAATGHTDFEEVVAV